MYTYKDFDTGKIRHTNGKFIGGTKPTGILDMPYAKFRRQHSTLLVPQLLLTADSLKAIDIDIDMIARTERELSHENHS